MKTLPDAPAKQVHTTGSALFLQQQLQCKFYVITQSSGSWKVTYIHRCTCRVPDPDMSCCVHAHHKVAARVRLYGRCSVSCAALCMHKALNKSGVLCTQLQRASKSAGITIAACYIVPQNGSAQVFRTCSCYACACQAGPVLGLAACTGCNACMCMSWRYNTGCRDCPAPVPAMHVQARLYLCWACITHSCMSSAWPRKSSLGLAWVETHELLVGYCP